MTVPVQLTPVENLYASGSVLACRVVMPDTAAALDKYNRRPVKHATAGATLFIGVTTIEATSTAPAENVRVWPHKATTVQKHPITPCVDYAAAATDRQPLMCAADGKVTPATGSYTQDQVVGWAIGDTAANTRGEIHLAR